MTDPETPETTIGLSRSERVLGAVTLIGMITVLAAIAVSTWVTQSAVRGVSSAVRSVEAAVHDVESAVAAIPEPDLRGVETAVHNVESAVAAIPQTDVSGLEAAMRDVEVLLTALEDIRDTLNQSTDYQQLPPLRPEAWLEEDSFSRTWLYWWVDPTHDRLPITEYRIQQYRPEISEGFLEITANSTTGGIDITDRGDLYAHEEGYEYTVVACNYQQRCSAASLRASD